MAQDYFQQLKERTASRFWINNPTLAEVELSLAQGAVNCTTNPAFCSRLLSVDREGLDAIIDAVVDAAFVEGGEPDYAMLAQLVYQKASKRLMDAFLPLYEATNGEAGYVTMQDDPQEDQNIEHTVRNIRRNMELSPNYMAKIPVIAGGIEAIEECVRLNVPICATEVFAVSQALCVARRYEAACKQYGNRPPIYVTHISGIFDEYLGKYAKRCGIEIDPAVLKQAGVSVARRQFQAYEDNGFRLTMLGGGARGIHHFHGIVGGPHITINWSTAEELMAADIPVKDVVREPVAQAVIDELMAKFPDYRKAYAEDGLSEEEFASFGPVQLFRNAFLKGWYQLLAEIADRKHRVAK